MDGTKLKRLQPNFFPQRPILTSGSPANNFFCFCSVVFNSLVSLPVSCCIMHVLSHDDGGGGNEKPVFCEKTKERDETNHLIERFEFFGALVPLFTSPDLYMRKERKGFWRPKLVVVGRREEIVVDYRRRDDSINHDASLFDERLFGLVSTTTQNLRLPVHSLPLRPGKKA